MLGTAFVGAIPNLPRPSNSGTAPSGTGGRAGVAVEVKLFFNRMPGSVNVLNTTPTTNAQTRQLPIEFPLENPLGADVEIIGKDLNTGGKGMWLAFDLVGSPYGNRITIEVLQDNSTVGNTTLTLVGAPPNRWDVPFLAGDDHVFPAGSVIKVRISSSLPSVLRYNDSAAYLLMPLSATPVTPSLNTYYAPGKPTTDFHPNWPDNVRRMRIEGDISSFFGPSDIKNVIVSIKNPSGDSVANGTSLLSASHYTYIWNYSKGQMPGNYNVTARASDKQNHEYTISTMVSMLRYGVFISSPSEDNDAVIKGSASPPRGGGTAKDAAYTLKIMNTGYSPTGATIRVSSNPPPNWNAVLSTQSIASINPGSWESITFTVSAGEGVDFGEKAVIYVEAIADSDTRIPKASWTVQSVTNATMSRNFELSISGSSENWVDVGQTVTYQIMARNKGILDMNITFSVSGVPVGWSHQVDVLTKVYLDTVSNSEKILNLKVGAPSEEVANLSRVAQISVTALCIEEPSLDKSVTTVTRLITILSLSVSPLTRTSDPAKSGGQVDFPVTITNLDPLNSHQVRITVTPPREWPSTSVRYDPKETMLNPNGTTTINVYVTPPSTAEANDVVGYQVAIKIEPIDQPTRSNSTTVIVKVRQRYEISLEISSTSIDVKPGNKVSLTATVKNLGNGPDSVVMYVAAGIPQDWKVYLNGVLSPPNPLSVALSSTGRAGDVQTINLTIEPSDISKDGQLVNITITAKSPNAPEKSIVVKTTVKKEWGEKLKDALVDSGLVILLTLIVVCSFVVVWRRNKKLAA